MLLEPSDGFIRIKLGGVTRLHRQGLAVAIEVGGIVIRGDLKSVVAIGVVKTQIVGLRLRRVAQIAVEVPFADEGGGVARLFEQRREREFGSVQINARPIGNPALDAGAIRRAAGQQSRARGRAERGRRIILGEPHALSGERIEVRRLDDWMAIAAQVAVAEIIDIN